MKYGKLLALMLPLVLAIACRDDEPEPAGITAAELQGAIAGIQIPEGLSEADVSNIVSSAMAVQPGITAADLQAAVDAAVATAAMEAAASAPAMMETTEPTGTLDVAHVELGAYQNHPAMVSFPQASLNMLTAADGLFGRGLDWEWYGKLATSWEVAPDNLTWTFHLREGVPFHDDWGEFTAEDWVYSMELAAQEGSINPRGPEYSRTFFCDDCYVRALDDHTFETNTGVPLRDLITAFPTPGSDPIWAVSKKQVTELEKSIGLDAANELIVSTGPWKIAENRPGEYWHFDAVEDHYLKTPYFAEMRFREIPEESTRIANFQTRRIDVFTAVPDTIALLANTPGTIFMAQEGAIEQHLLFYGNYYHSFDPSTCPGQPGGPWADRPKAPYCPAEGWDPDAPWVSANPDMDSPEWDAARKVRLAMNVAIDREKLIEELLHGEAVPLAMLTMSNNLPDGVDWTWEYDPARARQLLDEAGYPDGFEMDLYPAVRGAPSEVEACEAIAVMWENVRLDVNLKNIPFNTVVEGQLDRSSDGQVVCNAAPPFIESIWLWGKMYLPDSGWSPGMDHPVLSKMMDDTFNIFDREERLEATLEVSTLLWENTLDYGLWTVNQIHALSPEVGDWEEHLETGNPRRISGLEWAPHRQ